MAYPVTGGDNYPSSGSPGVPYYPIKRRVAEAVDGDHQHHLRHKRLKYAQPPQFANPVAFKSVDEPPPCCPPLDRRYPSPIPHFPSPEPAGAAAPGMERTASGHSIRPDPAERCASTELLDDHQAAQRVRDHLAAFRRRNPDSKHERILRSIINPRPRPHRHHRRRRHPHSHSHRSSPATPYDDSQDADAEDDAHSADDDEAESYPLDNAALESIFSAANEIFFNGRLSQRVAWDWSHASAARYDARVIGTTALRRAAAATRGFETLIVLSSPVLRDGRYSRRLLISTFLHELIHSYLFICCGFRARWCGGHTPGFRDIAGVMEEWIGEGGGLYLSRVEADLELFRIGGGRGRGKQRDWGGGGVGDRRDEAAGVGRTVNVYPCSGMAADQEEYAAAAAAAEGQGSEEVVYLGGGPTLSSRADAGGLGFGGIAPPSLRSTAGPREVLFHYDQNASGDSLSDSGSIWVRHRRAGPPLYVYSGDEPAAAYISPSSTWQRP